MWGTDMTLTVKRFMSCFQLWQEEGGVVAGGGGSGLEGPLLCLSFPAAKSSSYQALEDLQQDCQSTRYRGGLPCSSGPISDWSLPIIFGSTRISAFFSWKFSAISLHHTCLQRMHPFSQGCSHPSIKMVSQASSLGCNAQL